MTINLNTNKQTIKQLVELGLTNVYKHSPLCIQRKNLLEDAFRKGLINLNK